jgi:hypothetical protein
MIKHILAATAAILVCAPAAHAAEPIRYRVGLDLTGTWNETVRADLDEGDRDHDGTENVAVRDSALRFALKATMADVPLHAGTLREPLYDVAQTSLVQEVLSSTYTDFYGTSGTCSPQNAGATGGGTIAALGAALVFRPSSDAVLDLECVDPFVRFSMSVDLLRVAASTVVPELGEAPLDVSFKLPPGRFGERRIALPVSASAAQRAFARCPREDPGHTVACPFGWDGTVTLERLTPEVTGARLRSGAVEVRVRCATTCAPRLRAGAATKAFALPAGVTRRLTLARRGAPRRLTVSIGDERFAYSLNRSRPATRQASR